jgi:hypothetical protein
MPERLRHPVARIVVAALVGWTSLLAFPASPAGAPWEADNCWGCHELVLVTTCVESPAVADHKDRPDWWRQNLGAWWPMVPGSVLFSGGVWASEPEILLSLYKLHSVYRL